MWQPDDLWTETRQVKPWKAWIIFQRQHNISRERKGKAKTRHEWSSKKGGRRGGCKDGQSKVNRHENKTWRVLLATIPALCADAMPGTCSWAPAFTARWAGRNALLLGLSIFTNRDVWLLFNTCGHLTLLYLQEWVQAEQFTNHWYAPVLDIRRSSWSNELAQSQAFFLVCQVQEMKNLKQ